MSRSGVRYSKQQLQKAKAMYLQFKPLSEIEEETGVKNKALQYYVTKEWLHERKLMQSEMVDALSQSDKTDLAQISKYGLTLLKRGLKELAECPDLIPNAHLLKTVSAIVFETNKLKMAKELADPTPEVQTIEVDDSKLIEADPFAEESDEEIINCIDVTSSGDDSNSSTIDSQSSTEVCRDSDASESKQ